MEKITVSWPYYQIYHFVFVYKETLSEALNDGYDTLVTAIYYLNDSDGDTYIFDQDRKYNGHDLTIKKQVAPKQGRLVVFSGNLLHSGSNPRRNETRMVANINVVIVKE